MVCRWVWSNNERKMHDIIYVLCFIIYRYRENHAKTCCIEEEKMSQQETSSSSSSTAVATGENMSQHGIVGETFTEKFKRKFKAQPLVPMYVRLRVARS